MPNYLAFGYAVDVPPSKVGKFFALSIATPVDTACPLFGSLDSLLQIVKQPYHVERAARRVVYLRAKQNVVFHNLWQFWAWISAVVWVQKQVRWRVAKLRANPFSKRD